MEGKSHPVNTAVCTENMLESFQHSPRAGGDGGWWVPRDCVSRGSLPEEEWKLSSRAGISTEGL